jgi:ferredoxin-NADP reductase
VVSDGQRIGCVHAAYEQLMELERDSPEFYLCGWKDMITDARNRIQSLGIDKKSIHFELYG